MPQACNCRPRSVRAKQGRRDLPSTSSTTPWESVHEHQAFRSLLLALEQAPSPRREAVQQAGLLLGSPRKRRHQHGRPSAIRLQICDGGLRIDNGAFTDQSQPLLIECVETEEPAHDLVERLAGRLAQAVYADPVITQGEGLSGSQSAIILDTQLAQKLWLQLVVSVSSRCSMHMTHNCMEPRAGATAIVAWTGANSPPNLHLVRRA